jgi:cell division protease FtsH
MALQPFTWTRRLACLAACLVAALLTLAPAASAVPSSASPRRAAEAQRGIHYSYTDLVQDVSGGRIEFASFATVAGQVQVQVRGGGRYTVEYPPGAEQTLAKELTDSGATVTFDNASPTSAFNTVVMSLLIVALALALLVMVARRAGFGRMGADPGGAPPGLTRKTRTPPAVSDVRFCDVAGCDEAVEEAREMVDFLVDPSRFQALGARIPSGMLLYGPPGTGKTLLAKAIAGEAGCRLPAPRGKDEARSVSFFVCSGSEFTEMFVGVGAARIRELFAKAKKAAPAVIFIDELDAVGAKRGNGGEPGGAREDDRTLNQLLVEMDGFSTRDQVVVVAATNRLDSLDPALLRPGRLSRQVQVSTPDEAGRRAILAVHSAGKPLTEDADLDRLAHITAGQSGADLAEVMNEAAIWAARHERSAIGDDDLWEGLCRVVAGPKKASSGLAEGEREAVAYHEAGHVLAGELCPSQDKTQHATIQPRGRALGFALKGQTDRGLHDEQFLHEQLIFILGGRAAEYVKYQTVSSGAANDLQQANLLAREAVEKWGLSPRVGQLISTGQGFTHSLSEQMRSVIDEEVRRLVADAYRDAVRLISNHAQHLERIAGALLRAGHIDRPEIELAMDGAVIEPSLPRLSHSPELPPVYRPQSGGLEPAPAHDAEPAGTGHDGARGRGRARLRGQRPGVRPRLAAALLDASAALTDLARLTGGRGKRSDRAGMGA